MNEKLMTPAEIERATVERCAAMATKWGNARLDDHGGHACRNLAEALRALPPMFGDVPAYSVANDFRAWDAVHMKTGNVYRVVGEAIDATNAHSSRPMVIYQRDGKTYVRCAEEFIEKFKAIAAAPTAGQAAARIKELESEKSKAEALLDMWLWETVNQREEHADARKKTQEYFKRAGQAAAKDAQDAARYRWLRDRLAIEDIEHLVSEFFGTPDEDESLKTDSAVDSAMSAAPEVK